MRFRYPCLPYEHVLVDGAPTTLYTVLPPRPRPAFPLPFLGSEWGPPTLLEGLNRNERGLFPACHDLSLGLGIGRSDSFSCCPPPPRKLFPDKSAVKSLRGRRPGYGVWCEAGVHAGPLSCGHGGPPPRGELSCSPESTGSGSRLCRGAPPADGRGPLATPPASPEAALASEWMYELEGKLRPAAPRHGLCGPGTHWSQRMGGPRQSSRTDHPRIPTTPWSGVARNGGGDDHPLVSQGCE